MYKFRSMYVDAKERLEELLKDNEMDGPALPREVDQYKELQMQRMCVTPGVTYYWQIMPRRNEISFDGWMELDLKYI